MKLRKSLCIFAASLLLLLAGCSKAPEEDVAWYMKEDIRTFFAVQTTLYVYEYNEDWSTGSITVYENGEMLGTIIYEHTKNGYITRDGDDVTEVIYTKDEAGNATHTENYLNGQLSSTTDCTFDDKGNMLTYDTYLVEPEMHLHQQTEYNAQGNKVRMTIDNGYTTSVTEYTYDSQGRLKTESNPDSNSRTEYRYTDSGKVQTALSYDGTGELTGKSVTTYDEYGNALLQESFDAEGNLVMSSARSYISTDGRTSSGIGG